jgi:Dyp-type peroxidase family
MQATIETGDMQGLLVQGYGPCTHACFMIMAFGPTPEAMARTRAWLGTLPLTSGQRDREQSCRLNVAFTFRGLERLGLPKWALAGFSHEFRAGMTTPHRQRLLGDEGHNAPSCWDWGGDTSPVDMVLLAYAGSREDLQAHLAEIGAGIAAAGAGLCEVRRLESCPLPERKEHFGFRDGVSVPMFDGTRYLTEAPEGLEPGEFILGLPNEYGQITPRPLVSPGDDPNHFLANDVEGTGARDFGRNGSYLVFRQLQQHVYRFWSFVREAASQVHGADGDGRYVGLAAKIVGRWPSGAPLVLAPDEDRPDLAAANAFAYHHADPVGLACPIGAHVRRANPRDSLDPSPGHAASLAVNRHHRLLRRGRSYGPALTDTMSPEDILRRGDDGKARGLCFIALNTNIARQFEFIQSSWLNNPTFAGLHDDVDPLVGRRGRYGGDPRGVFTIPACPVRKRLLGIPDFVTVRGGAYFFLPSLSAVRFLASR